MNKDIIFLGSKEIGLACLKHLHAVSKNLNLNISGVLTNQRKLNDISEESIESYCKKHNLRLIKNLDKLLNEEKVDILYSVQYHEILKKYHLDKARQIAVNLHMAPLPEYRGCNQFSFAIIDNSQIFGTTIHKLEEGIDSGPILFEERFDIPNEIFVKELYELTYIKSIELFKKTLFDLISGNIKTKAQDDFINTRKTGFHFRSEISEIKKISDSWSKEKKKRHFRATWFPPFAPPVLVKNSEELPVDLNWYNSLK